MARNEHLLDNFLASKETRTLGSHILRLVQVKTGPGSGRELRELKGGLPAAAILIACEQLNTTEVTTKSAQIASCLKPKDFKKVYATVRAILEENNRASNITYEKLHANCGSELQFDILKRFITDVETEIIPRSGYDPESKMTKCAVYFWVLNCVEPDMLPSAEVFPQQYDLSVKKFINVLDIMNDHCKPIHKKIQSYFRKNTVSPSKQSATPRKSPRKVSTKSGPLEVEVLPSAQQAESPLRRSSRTASSLYGSNTSPTKPTLPLPWKKGPKRELPSKDSPKKDWQNPNDQDTVIPDELPRTPSKRRKLESPSKSTVSRTILPDQEQSSSSKSVPDHSPTREPSSKRRHVIATSDVASSSEPSDSEEPPPRGRFRPVYLEHRQWVAGDPRLASMWKKAEKFKASSIKRRVTSKSKA